MSALKTWILFLVVTVFVLACSDDSSPNKVSLSELDSSGKKIPADAEVIVTETGDSIVISGKDTIYLGSNDVPYFKPGVFCWTDECEKEHASQSASSKGSSTSSKTSSASGKSSGSTAKSSSSSAKSSSSSEPPVPPTVTDTELTDNRDGNTYKIEKIGDVTWMSENLKYKPSSGYYCDATVEVTVEKEGPDGGEGPGAGGPGAGGPGAQQAEEETITVNVCEYYGMFYSSQTAASSACPYGWRLPTQAEVKSALAEKEGKWWTLGGRFKLEKTVLYEKEGSEGRLWIQTTSDDKNCLQIMKSGDNVTTDYLNADAGERAFNVRCVMDSSN